MDTAPPANVTLEAVEDLKEPRSQPAYPRSQCVGHLGSDRNWEQAILAGIPLSHFTKDLDQPLLGRPGTGQPQALLGSNSSSVVNRRMRTRTYGGVRGGSD
jgi:hypothetical protein